MRARAIRMAAIARKEWAQIRRDSSTFGIAGLIPLILLFLFGYGISLDTGNTRVALILHDDGAVASELAAAFAASGSFDARPMASVAVAGDALVAGDVRGIIVIPAQFGRSVSSGRGGTVQVITDGSVPNTAAFIAGHARGLVETWAASRNRADAPAGQRATIRVAPHYAYNPEQKSRHFLVPGAIAIVMSMIGTMLTALVVAREWERGTMEALLASPMGVTEMIVAKVIPYFLLGLVSMGLCVLAAILVYDIPFRGSVAALLVLSSAFLFAALGQGLLISAASRNQFVSTQYALLSGFLPSLLLSGFLFEISSMPVAIQWLTVLVPARYLIPPLETVFLAGDMWDMIWPNVGALCLFGLFFFWRAIAATRKQLA